MIGKYSLLERSMLLPYNTIEGQYYIDGEFVLYVTFIVLVYIKYQ